MNLDLVTLNEVLNDGSTIYFYQEETTDAWVAWGYSAYLLSQMPGVNTLTSFSDKMQMPCVSISNKDFKGIVRNHVATIECKDGYYRLRTTAQVEDDAYQEWVTSLK